MGTKINSNYSDLLTFTRASKGHALRPVSYGAEIVTNGDFATDSDWTKGTGWTISSGTATHSGGVYGALTQDLNTTAGSVFILTADITYISGGGIQLLVNGVGPSAYTSTQSISYVFVAVGTDNISFGAGTGDWTIDNVSVKEVLFDQPDGTLTLFEHPNNVPRVEWDADRNRLGLLVEEARTNLDVASDFFAGGGGVTATKNHTAPDKTLSASTLSYSGGLTPYINTTNISFTSGTTYTFSFFFKRGTGTQNVQTLLYGSAFNGGGVNCVVIYDLDAETSTVASGSFTAHSVTKIGDGWYRCSCSSTATATISQNQQIYRAGTADDGNYDYIWGKQVEVGSFPTSYIKTTGSTATRSADVASIPVADFGYNQSAGTVLIDFDMKYNESGSGFPRVFEIDKESTNADRIKLQLVENTEALSAQVYSNFNVQAALNLGARSGGSLDSTKVAFAFKENSFAASDNSDTALTDLSGTIVPNTPRDVLALGKQTNSSARFLNGHIKSIQYYPRRLTNAQLQALTEPRSTPTLSLTFDGLESSYTENYIHG